MNLFQIHDKEGEQTGLILVTEDRLKRPLDELEEVITEVTRECGGDCDEIAAELIKHDVIAERAYVENIY